jgi:hypothetical protein
MSEFFEDHELEKLQSRLRVVANGDSKVNAIRAEHVGGLRVRDWTGIKRLRRGQLRAEESQARTDPDIRGKAPEVKKLKELPRNIEANVFVTMADPTSAGRLTGQTGSRGRYRTATVSLKDLQSLARDPEVAYVELGESIKTPQPIEGTRHTTFPTRTRRSVGRRDLHRGGEGVLIGIIDVQGFDFAHDDFQDQDGTRFVALWDQGAVVPKNPPQRIWGRAVPPTYRYGRHLDGSQLQAAQRIGREIKVPATDVEPQSQQVVGSHATHVASIAAGNHGVCP